MARRVKRIGHATSSANLFQGKEREITTDLTKKTAIIHDGLTPGGFPLAKEDLSTSPFALAGSKDGKMSAGQATELVTATTVNTTQDGRLNSMDTKNSTQDSNIATNTTNIATNTTNVATNTTNIATNTTNVAANLVKINTNTTNVTSIITPAVTTGNTNAFIVSLGISDYATGVVYVVNFHLSNGIGVTLDIDSKGAKNITNVANENILVGQLVGIHRLIYNGTNLVLLDPIPVTLSFYARNSLVQTIPSEITVKFDIKILDTNNFFSTSTNRFIPKYRGYYIFSTQIRVINAVAADLINLSFWHNTTGGSKIVDALRVINSTSETVTITSPPLFLDGNLNYVEVRLLNLTRTTSSVSASNAGGNIGYNFFSGHWVGF